MNMPQITKCVLYLINFKNGNRFATRIYYYLSNLLFRVFVGASDVLNAKEKKIGILKIENY